MTYINIKPTYEVKTIDQFETYKEAIKICKEYNLSDSYNSYYVSKKSTKEWRKEKWIQQ